MPGTHKKEASLPLFFRLIPRGSTQCEAEEPVVGCRVSDPDAPEEPTEAEEDPLPGAGVPTRGLVKSNLAGLGFTALA